MSRFQVSGLGRALPAQEALESHRNWFTRPNIKFGIHVGCPFFWLTGAYKGNPEKREGLGFRV